MLCVFMLLSIFDLLTVVSAHWCSNDVHYVCMNNADHERSLIFQNVFSQLSIHRPTYMYCSKYLVNKGRLISLSSRASTPLLSQLCILHIPPIRKIYKCSLYFRKMCVLCFSPIFAMMRLCIMLYTYWMTLLVLMV